MELINYHPQHTINMTQVRTNLLATYFGCLLKDAKGPNRIQRENVSSAEEIKK